MQLDIICTSRGLFGDIFLEHGCFWKRCPFELLYSELLYLTVTFLRDTCTELETLFSCYLYCIERYL